jgi:hypothetical protein
MFLGAGANRRVNGALGGVEGVGGGFRGRAGGQQEGQEQ